MKDNKSNALVICEYVQVFIDFIESQGIEKNLLLEGIEIHSKWLIDPNAQMPYSVFLQIIRRAIQLTDNPLLSVQFGTMLTLRTHGFLGYAALSSETYRDAIDLAVRYYRTRYMVFDLKLSENDNYIILQFDELIPHGDLLPFVTFMTLSSFYTMAVQLIGERVHEDLEVRITFEKPEDFLHPEEIPVPIIFGCSSTQVRFPIKLLDVPLGYADPRLAQMAAQQCEEELQSLPQRSSLLSQVKSLIISNLAERITQEDVADHLHMGTRTLKRRLKSLGLTYQELVDDIKRNLAIEYLTQTNKTVEDIGWSLGYSDPSNFGRAFRRWTDLSPSNYREKYQGKYKSELNK